ncbi:MAG: PQQ-binding-like beta-propeller repeat protein [Planctomycetes bacterium]|nr:PQQ-binding-like beta-propeller repeat protein [Planctomycetota bacterium]
MRSTIAALLLLFVFSFLAMTSSDRSILAQEKKLPVDKKDPLKDLKVDLPEEKFDQKKADIETLKTANLPFESKPLLDFFKNHTVSDTDRARLSDLIRQLGDEDFDKREEASELVEKFGVSAIGLLRQAERSGDPEVLRRCERCLKNIEKVPTRTLASAAARLLADLKPEGLTEVMLNFLPLAEDDIVGDDIRGTLSAIAMRDGKPDPLLIQTLESKELIKRSAAAEAFTRGGDTAMRDKMRQFMAKEPDNEIKLKIAINLVMLAKKKDVIEDMIKLMGEVPLDSGWRAEEILLRLAGEKGPTTSLGADKPAREKARDEWIKWWAANEKTVDLAKLDEMERTLGYTLIVEMDVRGQGGRVKEITPDGKVRWQITNVQFPTDALVLPGNRVIVAEQNTNRVSERDTATGKEIWGATFNQPIGLQRLSNGNLVVIGRHQTIEWDRERKAVATITRQQYDVIAGAKLRNGNYCLYTQQGLLVTYDKDGKQIDSFNAGRGNYNSTMQVLANGKLILTQLRGIAEVDLAAKKADVVMTYNFPTSAQKLPNGNILVSNQNTYQVVEMEPKTNKTVWEHKPDKNDNFFRAWRVKRR